MRTYADVLRQPERDIGLDNLFAYLNLALTAGATTVNNQNVLHGMVDGILVTKAAGATAVATAGPAFSAFADGQTIYGNLLLGSDAAWLIQQGAVGLGVPDPNDLHTALAGVITAVNTANPVQITSSAHGLKTGDQILVDGLPALTINGKRFKVTRVDANNVTLNGVNGATIGTYTSGGFWRSQRLARIFCAVLKVVLSGSSGFTFGTTNWNATGVTASALHYAVAPAGEKP
jgi:hypothetical protein